MLTGDLLRVKIQKKEVCPQFIDSSSKRYLEYAGQILDAVRAAQLNGHPRHVIDAVVSEICEGIMDFKVVQGIAKIMLDRCEFSSLGGTEELPILPSELRLEIFSLAQKSGGISYMDNHDGQQTADDLFDQLALKYDTSRENLKKLLYGDLKEMQVVSKLRDFSSPEQLLSRYNLALCQAILLRAKNLKIDLVSPDSKMLRMLFRVIKFHRLMFSVTKAGDDLSILLDGPQSLLKQSTRYGMQLANSFPCLPLFKSEWSVSADLSWGKKRKFNKVLSLNSASGLRSHYQRTGTWRSNAEIWFEERFLALKTDWSLEMGEIMVLSNQSIIIPDFSFRKGDALVHLEIIGFWRKDYLKKRIKSCPENVLLAVSRKLMSDKGTLPKKLEERVIYFSEIISAKEVLLRLEKYFLSI